MTPAATAPPPPGRVRIRTGLVLLAIVAVLGLAVAGITWWLRAGLREQILRREGESLYAVAALQQAVEEDRLDELGLEPDDEQLAVLALQTSRLRGVLGVQVFDAAGQTLQVMPATLNTPAPADGDWKTLRRLQPVVRYAPAATLENVYGLAGDAQLRMPLLEITVPLHPPGDTQINGAARYLIDGQPIERELTRLDRGLVWQAGLVWLLAAGGMVLTVGAAFRRLARANAALQARTEDLVRANRELALAAKTSALGAVTAHLVHGLRNPIAGLETFIEGQRGEGVPAPEGEWSEATATARRMREMVNEVVGLIQDEQSGTLYELSWREVLETVAARVAGIAARKQVLLTVATGGAGMLTNHQAGLVSAILTNLAQNACEALRAGGGRVTLSAKPAPDGGVEFRVEDNGPGLPEEIQTSLFHPRMSSKPGGAGIGLAISRQLAVHLGGTLELVDTNAAGVTFRLVLPPP